MGYDNKRLVVWLGIAVSAACGDTSQGSGVFGALSASDQNQCGDPGVVVLKAVDSEATGLECPRGGGTAPVRVVFACDEITVITCKDLSNVVVELADGSRRRVEGLNGHRNTFSATGEIVGVWVKAGANHSGDGPGYGQRFDAPAGNCDPTNTPPGDTPPGDNTPPGDTPPGDTPPGDTPPGDSPPGDTPPGDTPPGDTPPGENDPPCVVTPPPDYDPPTQDPPSGGDDPVVVF